MVDPGRRVSFVLAALCLILAGTRGDRVAASGCPCSIWTPAAAPANAAVTDGQPIEVGVKFRSDVGGFVTALRFYKGAANTGTHVGHLWSASGALLAEATFTDESALGLAGGCALAAGRDHRELDIRRVLSQRFRLLRLRQRILLGQRRRLAAAARAAGGCRWPQRRLSLRRERLSLGRRQRTTTGSTSCSDRPRARHHAARGR